MSSFVLIVNEKKFQLLTDYGGAVTKSDMETDETPAPTPPKIVSKNFVSLYWQLCRSLGTYGQDFAIFKSEIEEARAIYVWDTTSQWSSECEEFQAGNSHKPCTFSVQLKFDTPIKEAVNMLIVLEFERSLHVNKAFEFSIQPEN